MLTTVKNLSFGLAVKSALIDIFALVFIFMIPTIAHVVPFPLYFIEPMRIMVILAMAHTHRNNAYILALALPVFSFFLSGHPILIKALIISAELMVMVGVFYLLRRYIHAFAAIFSAIIISKLFYFAVKFFAPLEAMRSLGYSSFFEFSLFIQLATSLVLSLYLYMIFRNKTA
jgi:hypothetical protein